MTHTSLDSQRNTLHNDIKHVNVSYTLEINTPQKYNGNFENIFLNWIISVITGAKFIKFGGLTARTHLEGTVSQNFN